MSEITRPTRRMDRYQTVHVVPIKKKNKKQRRLLFALLVIFVIYFIAPLRTNILILGTDASPNRGSTGRTDTIILTSIVPLKPYIGMLSIPRDLWVTIPNVGEQRINTAYYFSELNQTGSGADATMNTIRENFDVPVQYYVIIHMPGLISVIDSLGGVDIQLDVPTGGYSAGTHHLTGIQTLAFARDRSTSDDFSRMLQTQVLLSAVLGKILAPASWSNLPQFVPSLLETVETNIPLWQLPRLLFALLRVPLFGIDSRTITREMVTPFVTSGGAQVLLPNWDAINLLLREMFAR